MRTVRFDADSGDILVETRREPLRIQTEGVGDQVRYTLTDPRSGAETHHSNLHPHPAAARCTRHQLTRRTPCQPTPSPPLKPYAPTAHKS